MLVIIIVHKDGFIETVGCYANHDKALDAYLSLVDRYRGSTESVRLYRVAVKD